MPKSVRPETVNWYQYVNDNSNYRSHIRKYLSFLYKNSNGDEDIIKTIGQLQLAKFINNLIRIDNVILLNFATLIVFSRQINRYLTVQPSINLNKVFETLIMQNFNNIYEKWPKTLNVPKINQNINYQNLFGVDMTLINNPSQKVPTDLLTSNYQSTFQFMPVYKILAQNTFYPKSLTHVKSHLKNLNNISIREMSYNFNTPTKEQIYRELRQFKWSQPFSQNQSDYRFWLIMTLWSLKYQKYLKNKLWRWYLKHHVADLDPHLMSYLKNYFHITSKAPF